MRAMTYMEIFKNLKIFTVFAVNPAAYAAYPTAYVAYP